MHRKWLFCAAAVASAALLAGGTVGMASGAISKTCPIVPFGNIAGMIGKLKPAGTGAWFTQSGPNPKAGYQSCTATSKSALVQLNVACRIPLVNTYFHLYSTMHSPYKGLRWTKVGGLGDEAYYVTGLPADNASGHQSAVSVRKGRTIYDVDGSVGNTIRPAALKPMTRSLLVSLARKSLGYSCP